MKLSPIEVRAAYHAVASFRRNSAISGRSIPPAVIELHQRLDAAVRSLSQTRHNEPESSTSTEQLRHGEWIGAKLAARRIGCSSRTVQRHANDLGGQMIGHQLIFSADAIDAYIAERSTND